MACAPTGSGKTIAFVLPALQLLQQYRGEGFQVLIISPTRELAAQIFQVVQLLSRGKKFKLKLLSKPLEDSSTYDVIVTTPLRLVQEIQRGHLDLSAHVPARWYDVE
jgi:ATP-dependent RNA helicase DDX52/ROK1